MNLTTNSKSSSPAVWHKVSRLTDDDVFLFNEGTHYDLQHKLGSRPLTVDGVDGTYFAVWAPNAERVSVIGDFNQWNKQSHPLRPRQDSGIWEGFIPNIGVGTHYKYHIESRWFGYCVDKSDPFGIYHEVAPQTASIVWDNQYQWHDEQWMTTRATHNAIDRPTSVYEVHLGSWKRVAAEGHRSLSYRELAPELANHVKKLGFTHVEMLPVMEHPFFGSWGYQVTGFFAPSSRYGSPQDFKFLVDFLHQEGIGVILDWVPSHFPCDEHGLGFFDGSHLFEHQDPRQGYHPDWNSLIFNYGRNEVRSFLLSNALFWLDEFHADALRVDAVASMLYLDYSRNEGQWIPNKYGGRENLEAIDFLKTLNEQIYQRHPDTQTVAEESTAWPMVSRPTYVGGLGFGMKWDMGWMHDTLEYIRKEPIHRRYHHGDLTFRMIYAFNENFVLPLSHDEVVHGKGSLLNKMPGDEWQKRANLRALYGYMYAMPGKKLLFMGAEIGQWDEWRHDGTISWELLQLPEHQGIERLLGTLNHCYRSQPALHQLDCDPHGFEWIDANDSDSNVISFLRKARDSDDQIIVVCNFSPVIRENYRVGVSRMGYYHEIFNTDAGEYGGAGQGNFGGVEATPVPFHGRPYSLNLTLPPLSVIYLRRDG